MPATQLPTVSSPSLYRPHGAPRPGERITRAWHPGRSALDSLLLPALPGESTTEPMTRALRLRAE